MNMGKNAEELPAGKEAHNLNDDVSVLAANNVDEDLSVITFHSNRKMLKPGKPFHLTLKRSK